MEGSLMRGWSHMPILTPSIGIPDCKSVESGGPTSIYQHDRQQFHSWNRTKILQERNHDFDISGGGTLEYGNIQCTFYFQISISGRIWLVTEWFELIELKSHPHYNLIMSLTSKALATRPKPRGLSFNVRTSGVWGLITPATSVGRHFRL